MKWVSMKEESPICNNDEGWRMAIPYCLKKYSFKNIPPLYSPVVYFLWYEDECVYVGQTLNVYRRILNHRSDKLFTNISFIKVKDKTDLNEVEQHYIILLKPFYNLNTIRTPSLLDKYYIFGDSLRYRTLNRGTKNKRNEDIIREHFIPKFNHINKEWIAPNPVVNQHKSTMIKTGIYSAFEKNLSLSFLESQEYIEYRHNSYKIINNPSILHWLAYISLTDELLYHIEKDDIDNWIDIILIPRFQHHNNCDVQFNLKLILMKTKEYLIDCYKTDLEPIPESVVNFNIQDDIIFYGNYDLEKEKVLTLDNICV